jgi:hypothetical protein
VLHYFGLDCGMLDFLKYSNHKPKSKEQLLTLPHFWSTFGGKDRGLCSYKPKSEQAGLDGFLYEVAQKFEVFSNVQNEK